jgi:glutathionylspermidine synthase
MGRIANLCGEIAAAYEEGPEGRLVLPPEAWDRLRQSWSEEEIEDALDFVHDSILQGELVESADSLSARLVELLGTFGEAKAWAAAVEGHASISIDEIRQLAHRVERLEEILEVYRDQKAPDRRAFDELQRRLMDQGIEEEMRPDWEKPLKDGTSGESGS